MAEHECCILFFHHKDDAATQQHFQLLKQRNPYPVTPLICDDGHGPTGINQSIQVPLSYERGHNWQNADLILAEWFRGPYCVEARRYIWFEWDVYATAPVNEWYSEVWDRDAVGVSVFPGNA